MTSWSSTRSRNLWSWTRKQFFVGAIGIRVSGSTNYWLLSPPTEPTADFCYRIYNSDGSSAQQCGNGTRCVAMLVRHLRLSKQTSLHWQSAAGMLRTEYESPEQIETTMTVPVLALPDIPFDPSAATATNQADLSSHSIAVDGESYDIMPVSMGNPHGVMFCDDIFNIDVPGIGQKLTRHEAFPEGANIGFCQVIDRQFIRLRVFETRHRRNPRLWQWRVRRSCGRTPAKHGRRAGQGVITWRQTANRMAGRAQPRYNDRGCEPSVPRRTAHLEPSYAS